MTCGVERSMVDWFGGWAACFIARIIPLCYSCFQNKRPTSDWQHIHLQRATNANIDFRKKWLGWLRYIANPIE